MTIDVAELIFKDRDEFKRELVADKVIQLLTSDIEITPMVIDGSWGTGKTEFCHKLINKLKITEPDINVLYIDAFQADHADNPLMTILAAVMNLLPEGEKKKNLLKKAIPVVRYGLATAGKAIAGHILKQNADVIADGFTEHLEDAADKAIDASVKSLLKNHEKSEENLKALQETMADIAKDSAIIIFIDELDRCRPDYSVQMLEVIKHTFNVDNVTFVLVMNTQQLKAAINHRYGLQVDAQRYLDKFLKFTFQLPNKIPNTYAHQTEDNLAAIEHLSNLITQSSILKNSCLTNNGQVSLSFTKKLTEINRLSLREVETFVRHLEVYQSLSQGKGLTNNLYHGYQLLRIFGVFVACFSTDIKDSINTNRVDGQKITELLGFYKSQEQLLELAFSSRVDAIAFMLAKESHINGTHNNLNKDLLNRWAEHEVHYFGHMNLRTKNKFDILREVIDTLDLAN